MSTMRMRRKEKKAATASTSTPLTPPTLKEKYATTIGEATAATFQKKRFFAKNVRHLFRALFTRQVDYVTVLLTMPPHINKMALAIDDRFGGNFAITVKKALLKADFHPYNSMESIDCEMLTVAQDVVDENIGDLIDGNENLRKMMLPLNVVLNTNHHIARALNEATMSFYAEYPETYFDGFEDSSHTFIDDFTDDFFQEYMERHQTAAERRTFRDIIENEPDFSEDEEEDRLENI